MRAGAAVLAFVLTASASAAELTLGPVLPLDKSVRRDGPPSAQTAMSMLWTGQKGLAVWNDKRGTYPPDSTSSAIRPSSVIYASPMRADGSLELPAGRRVMDGESLTIAAADETHVLATGGTTTNLWSLDITGNVLAPPKLIPFGSIVSNGTTFLTQGGQLYDLNGNPTVRNAFFNTYSFAPLQGEYIGGKYMPNGDVLCQTLTDSGTFNETKVGFVNNERSGWASIIAGDNQAMIVVTTYNTVDAFIVDRQGKLLRAVGVYRSWTAGARETPVWDGTNYLVIWNVPSPSTSSPSPFSNVDWTTHSRRITPNGELLDDTFDGKTIAASSPISFKSVRTSAGVVMRWEEELNAPATDEVGGTFGSTTDLIAAAPPAPLPAVTSAAAQTQIRFAAPGGIPIATWRESSGTSRIMMAIGDYTYEAASSTTNTLVNPVAVRNNDQIFIAWRSLKRFGYGSEYFSTGDLFARRFALDGKPLDASPLQLATLGSFPRWDDPIEASFDGVNYVVIWPTSSGLYASRVTTTGEVVPVLSPIQQAGCCDWAPHALPTDSGMLVFWSHTYPSQSTSILATRFDTRLPSPLPGSVATVASIGPTVGTSAIAWSDDRGLVAWSDANCVSGMIVDRNGNIFAGPQPLACEGGQAQTSAAWSGSEFVVAWAKLDKIGGVRGIRVGPTLRLLDDAPFDIGSDAYEPSLVQNGSGVTIGYVATGIDDVTRAFYRTLQRLAGSTRGRAVRH